MNTATRVPRNSRSARRCAPGTGTSAPTRYRRPRHQRIRRRASSGASSRAPGALMDRRHLATVTAWLGESRGWPNALDRTIRRSRGPRGPRPRRGLWPQDSGLGRRAGSHHLVEPTLGLEEVAAGVRQALPCRARLFDAEEPRPHPDEEQGHQASGTREVRHHGRRGVRGREPPSRQPPRQGPRSRARQPAGAARRVRTLMAS